MGYLLEISPSVNYCFGYNKNEVIGMNVSSFYLNLEDGVGFVTELAKKKAVVDYEITMKSKAGNLLYTSVNAHLIFDVNGNLNPIDGVFKGYIAERKKTEMEIADKNIKLEIQNKELEEFTYIASHDLQEPLVTLKSFSELLKEETDYELKGNAKQYLDFIIQSSTHMRELVKGLLGYSRIGKVETMNLEDYNQIVNTVVADLQVSVKKNHAKIFIWDLPELLCNAL